MIDLARLFSLGRRATTRLCVVVLALVWLSVPVSAGFNEAGQTPGTTTNDSADPGNVGEDLAASVPPPIASRISTVTISIATPAVISWSNPPFGTVGPMPVVFTTTGALPTGITAGATYWSIPSTVTSSGFEIATSIANAFAGTAVATSGTQSGTQTGTLSAPLTTGTSLSVTGLLLTPGDWQVFGNAAFYGVSTTVVNGILGQMQTGVNSVGGAAVIASQGFNGATPFASGSITDISMTLVPLRVTVPASTTQIIYLNMQGIFTTNALYGMGAIEARRMR